MEKQECRKYIRELKKRYSLAEKKEKSAEIWKKVEHNTFFRDARTVLIYWSMDDEVYTHDFIRKWADRKTFLLPCVRGGELEIYYYEGEDKMCPGEAFGILEPTGQQCPGLDCIDLVLVPGVAFDREGNRLGRGKGYYDKILRGISAWKIGIGFDFQVLDHIPVEAFDVKMDEVIC